MIEKKEAIEFTKMQGAGNDYIYIDCLENTPSDLSTLSKEISDRHFGIGSDGLVAIMASDVADFRMRMFNADGSEAQMCGNASRCIGKYVFEKGLTDKSDLTLETLSGIKKLHLTVENGEVREVTVDMGTPELIPANIPAISEDEKGMISEDEIIGGVLFRITAVSMGNPHAVIFSNTLTDRLVHGYGPQIETSPLFPERTNVEFVNVTDRHTLEMRVWERGSGETMACGTGACAAVVAAALNDVADREATVKLLGGELRVRWDEKGNHVYLTGGCEFICDGVYYRQGFHK